MADVICMFRWLLLSIFMMANVDNLIGMIIDPITIMIRVVGLMAG